MVVSRVFRVVLFLSALGIGGIVPRSRAVPPAKDSGPPLLQAVRSGDTAAVKAFLAQGVDVNARDGSGTTALMLAVLHADTNMVRLLLDKGADVNTKNKAGATALMWAVGNYDKVKALLDKGAEVNARAASGFTALMIAVNSDAATETVKLLVKKGAKVNHATKSGYTVLMAAADGGDVEVVKLLLAKGADAKAKTKFGWTALHSAAVNGNPDIVKALLEKGADVNARETFHGRTPLMWAAAGRSLEAVKLLLARGADVNIRETFNQGVTALFWAAAGEDVPLDTLKALLAKGADPAAKDTEGHTALTWARKRGETAAVKLLKDKGAPQLLQKAEQNLKRVGEANTVKEAVARSVPLLQKSGPAFLNNSTETCFSCHHQSLPALAVALARTHGFRVDKKLEREQAATSLRTVAPKQEMVLQGIGLADRLDPAYLLAGLAAAGQARDVTTDALVHYLTLKQQKDGRWRTIFHRPPMDDGDFTATALSLHALQRFAPPGRKKEMAHRVERARAWLAAGSPKTTEDRAFQLLGLEWAQAKKADRQKAVKGLLALQRADGGWGQLPSMGSDAYATGQVLTALHQGGGLSVTAPAYQRGVRFLLKTQFRDGSWFVPSRSMPVQPYFESGFPHGKDQFISCAATAWGTMALALTGTAA
jgi:ankyrin repeat protein